MAFVMDLPETEAGPELEELYSKVRKDFGFLPNYFAALGPTPQFIEVQRALADTIMRDGALPRIIKEQIAIVVSGINSSSYCIAVHLELLRRFGIEKPIGRKLAVDYPHAPVSENVQVLFRFADKLTRTPFEVTQADIATVRDAGWNDAQVVETVMVTSLFAFANRVSAGLGVVADF